MTITRAFLIELASGEAAVNRLLLLSFAVGTEGTSQTPLLLRLLETTRTNEMPERGSGTPMRGVAANDAAFASA